MRDLLNKKFGISLEIIAFCEKVYNDIQPQIAKIQEISRHNQIKVLSAFGNNRVSSYHLQGTTGYGYNDIGRDVIDAVYAEAFEAEDALVRHTIISGTHAISLCLFSVLRPGDTLVSATGKPYDTLDEAIGIRGEKSGSLKEFGIKYRQVELSNGKVDYNNIMSTIDESTKAVFFQKSRGYEWRGALTSTQIGEAVAKVKSLDKNIICIVDNCYGEFTETEEPTKYGVDMVAGSLIKNPGGGLAQTGGYIAGRRDLIEQAAYRLNCVGLGKHVGATLDVNRYMLQGLFVAPHVVGEAMKSALYCGAVFKALGFGISPDVGDIRGDIVQAIKFGTKEGVIEFCKGIQKGSPIDNYVTPEPWAMPGYDHDVIMAAGGFVQGSSIELSADAPIKPPYIAYMQGGITFDSAYVGIATAVQNLADKKLIKDF